MVIPPPKNQTAIRAWKEKMVTNTTIRVRMKTILRWEETMLAFLPWTTWDNWNLEMERSFQTVVPFAFVVMRSEKLLPGRPTQIAFTPFIANVWRIGWSRCSRKLLVRVADRNSRTWRRFENNTKYVGFLTLPLTSTFCVFGKERIASTRSTRFRRIVCTKNDDCPKQYEKVVCKIVFVK